MTPPLPATPPGGSRRPRPGARPRPRRPRKTPSASGAALLLAAVAVAVASPSPVGAQEDCQFLEGTGTLRSVSIGTSRITYIGSPNLLCRGGVRIRADSGQVFEASNFTQLFGNVRFEDSERRLRARDAQYQSRIGRLQAQGDVVLVRKADGSEVRGENLVYLRGGVAGREGEQLTVTGGRPEAVLYPGARPAAGGGGAEAGPGADTLAAAPGGEPGGAEAGATGERPGAVTEADGAVPVMYALLPVAPSLRVRSLVREAGTPEGAPGPVAPPGPDAPEPAPTDTAGPSAAADTAGPLPPDTAGLPAPGPGRAAAAAPPDTATAPATPEPGGPPPVPWHVVADRIHLEGESYFRAVGSVEIDREGGLEAFADSVEYEQAEGVLDLRGDARAVDQGFQLTGERIVVVLPGDEIRRVEARGDALLVGTDVRLESPVIHMFLEEGRLQRLVAVPDASEADEARAGGATGPPAEVAQAPPEAAPAGAPPEGGAAEARIQPRAEAEGFVLTADSIEVEAPGEVLERIFASGAARGVSSGRDSLNTEETPEVARRDWIEGDTIIATFTRVVADSAAPSAPGAPGGAAGSSPDSTEYRLDRMVARGSARSLYRMVPADSAGAGGGTARADGGAGRAGRAPCGLAIHYVTGREIVIGLDDGEVERMDVTGPTRGWHLEPLCATAGAAVDTTATPADSLEASPDTAAVPIPDTAAAPPPDTAAAQIPDTAGAPLPATADSVGPPPETAAASLPDTAGAPLPDTAAASPPETAAASPPDTAGAPLPDTEGVSPSDTSGRAPADRSLPVGVEVGGGSPGPGAPGGPAPAAVPSRGRR